MLHDSMGCGRVGFSSKPDARYIMRGSLEQHNTIRFRRFDSQTKLWQQILLWSSTLLLYFPSSVGHLFSFFINPHFRLVIETGILDWVTRNSITFFSAQNELGKSINFIIIQCLFPPALN